MSMLDHSPRKKPRIHKVETDVTNEQVYPRQLSPNIVSPQGNKLVESCTLSPHAEQQKYRDVKRPPHFKNQFIYQSVNSMVDDAPRFQVASLEPSFTGRMSPNNSEFLINESHSRRSEQPTYHLVPQVSESFSLQPPSCKSPCSKKLDMSKIQANSCSNSFEPTQSIDQIHDTSRGAFNRSDVHDPSDKEVENILSSNHCDPWNNIPRHHHQQQPYYQQPRIHYHHPEHYSMGPNYPHYYLYDYQYHGLGQHPGYFHHTPPMYYYPYNTSFPYYTPYMCHHSNKRKFECEIKPSSRNQYYVYTDRPSSPMSDITGASSFDDLEEFFDDEPKCTSHSPIITKSTERKPLVKEPRIERNEMKLKRKTRQSTILRTVSPLRNKQTLGTKIWRSRIQGSTHPIANNVSCTFSE